MPVDDRIGRGLECLKKTQMMAKRMDDVFINSTRSDWRINWVKIYIYNHLYIYISYDNIIIYNGSNIYSMLCCIQYLESITNWLVFANFIHLLPHLQGMVQ